MNDKFCFPAGDMVKILTGNGISGARSMLHQMRDGFTYRYKGEERRCSPVLVVNEDYIWVKGRSFYSQSGLDKANNYGTKKEKE